MNSKHQKIMLYINGKECLNWRLFLENELKNTRSNNIEIFIKNLDLSCKDVLELIEIANQNNCKITSFSSTSTKTIVSSNSLGYRSQFIVENHLSNTLEIHDENFIFSNTHFHQGTLRSGQYLESPGNLLILGDVNPGAIVRAERNIIIWGRLLGIAHAGSKGNSKATISALQLRPVQLRIANKVARGPKEKPQIGLVEQARIDSEKIVIFPLENL